MSNALMTVEDAWFEHTMASIKWEVLRSSMPTALDMAVSAALDLYVGGAIFHRYENGSIYCINCEYLENLEVSVRRNHIGYEVGGRQSAISRWRNEVVMA